MTYVNLQLNPERYTGYTGPSARKEFGMPFTQKTAPNEERILYKLISGLHSSITVHLAADYLLDEATNSATDYLEHAEYDTGNPIEDLKTKSLIKQLLYNPKLQAACPLPFDEANALMDCVGCEKCRLWGKLQVLGLGTALKSSSLLMARQTWVRLFLLFQPAAAAAKEQVIALLNLLNRLSESVKFVHKMGPSAEA
ncbi:hypothetical protein FNV43_RR06629 [Rhamnella rubrinervis]|uniref:Uncharacterized protein n=1 Tax=Rhamnella rubrinervis TaxID=2594499 RepID=A0A8K0HDA8_9ROSA|nr:hypothetical protein FNV43_RR06629 [Rhamnella rubrinervis]